MARWTLLDPTNVDLTDFDLAHLEQLTGDVTQRAVELAKDATYITVGLGLLGFQRMQVRRRELERQLRR